MLAQAAGPAGRVAGIDISNSMRRIAEQRIGEARLGDRIELLTADVPPLPWAEATFDVAFMSFTLELFPLGTIQDLLAELHRVLRPGGRLGVVAMTELAEVERENAATLAYRWLHRHFPHIVDCRPIDARGFLERAGFVIGRAEVLEVFTIPVAILVGIS
jgi:demethylmenaquinone methyltransferase/2-methoxy-6-polyprenyl-1,4-benzoquinol methylase